MASSAPKPAPPHTVIRTALASLRGTLTAVSKLVSFPHPNSRDLTYYLPQARPQRFFGLHIVHPDKVGGGIFRVLPAKDLVAALSPQSVEVLLRTEFAIQVPAEFYKGQASNKGRLLQLDPTTGHYLLRFRRDILADPSSADPAANAAVEELNALLDNPETKGWRFPDDVFRENVVLLMDNARFLHMRTEIRDKRRLLRRVRFHGPAGN